MSLHQQALRKGELKRLPAFESALESTRSELTEHIAWKVRSSRSYSADTQLVLSTSTASHLGDKKTY